MRVAFSGLFLDRPDTGTGQYARNVLRGMLAIGRDTWLVLVASEAQRAAALEISAAAGAVDRVTVRALTRPTGGDRAKLWLEQVSVPRAAETWQADVLHVPYFGSPARARVPVAVTIHDLIMLVLPEHRGDWRVRAYTTLVGAAARRARLVFADSDATRQDVLRLLGIAPDRVVTAHLAVDHEVFRRAGPRATQLVRQRYGIPDGAFVLYIGGFDRRKNVPLLLRAFAAADVPGRLVLAGRLPEPGALFPNIPAEIEALGLRDRVVTTGFIDEVDKPALYSAARFLVYPSRYEGFGLPVLEAMACGTPVIASAATSLPEICGRAAVAVDPVDLAALTGAIHDLWHDDERLRRLRAAGPRRARRFTWDQTARRTLEGLHAITRG